MCSGEKKAPRTSHSPSSPPPSSVIYHGARNHVFSVHGRHLVSNDQIKQHHAPWTLKRKNGRKFGEYQRGVTSKSNPQSEVG